MKISNHARERYAERIRKLDDVDVKSYVALHLQKIDEDLETMFERSEHIYSGRSISEYNKNIVDVHLCHDWCLIYDPGKDTLVTLYKIDLNIGQEFNNLYIEKALEKLNVAKKDLEDERLDVLSQEEAYRNIIHENENQIAELKRTIDSLVEQNNAYKSMIDSFHSNIELKEQKVREVVAGFVGRRVF